MVDLLFIFLDNLFCYLVCFYFIISLIYVFLEFFHQIRSDGLVLFCYTRTSLKRSTFRRDGNQVFFVFRFISCGFDAIGFFFFCCGSTYTTCLQVQLFSFFNTFFFKGYWQLISNGIMLAKKPPIFSYINDNGLK